MIETANGADSVAKAASERPDLVLMDIQLPVLDGYDAARRIKALPDLAAVPIILNWMKEGAHLKPTAM